MTAYLICLIVTALVVRSCCTVLASTGYVLATPNVRDFLIKSGLAGALSRKTSMLYEASNFRYASDQGTNVRKAAMDDYDIVEVDSSLRFQKKISPIYNHTGEDDRIYSEKLFTLLNEMDRNECVSRLLCEIGAEPKPFGMIGFKINLYLKSVPPVTWNSATFPYMEAFQGGLSSGKDLCNQHYSACSYDLKRVVKYLWLFVKPLNLKVATES